MTNQSLGIELSAPSGFAGANEALSPRADEALETLGELLKSAVGKFGQSILSMEGGPNGLELQMGLGLKAEGKWIILSASTEATVSAKMVWSK